MPRNNCRFFGYAPHMRYYGGGRCTRRASGGGWLGWAGQPIAHTKTLVSPRMRGRPHGGLARSPGAPSVRTATAGPTMEAGTYIPANSRPRGSARVVGSGIGRPGLWLRGSWVLGCARARLIAVATTIGAGAWPKLAGCETERESLSERHSARERARERASARVGWDGDG